MCLHCRLCDEIKYSSKEKLTTDCGLVMVLPSRVCFCEILKAIIDYGSAFVIYGNETESRGVQFPGRGAPDKINGGMGAANLQSPVRDSWKISALVTQ